MRITQNTPDRLVATESAIPQQLVLIGLAVLSARYALLTHGLPRLALAAFTLLLLVGLSRSQKLTVTFDRERNTASIQFGHVSPPKTYPLTQVQAIERQKKSDADYSKRYRYRLLLKDGSRHHITRGTSSFGRPEQIATEMSAWLDRNSTNR